MKKAVLILVGAILLAACGGGGGGGGGGDGGGPSLFVVIENPGATTVTATTTDLYGIASCDGCPPSTTAFGFCPAVDPPRESAIDVTWTNRATGASGITFHAVVGRCSCLFSQCTVSYSHRWSASVPLAVGTNAIDVRASGPGGAPGLDTVSITRLPAAPADLAAAPGNGQVTLSWSPVAGATSYDAWFSTSRDFTTVTGTKIAGVSSPFTHTNLANDVTYYYRLVSVSGAVESVPSDISWATPGWRTEDISATAAPAMWRDVSIATDSAGFAHVHQSFQQDIGSVATLHNEYWTNATGSWAALPVGRPVWVSAGIALDAADTVHAGFLDSAGVTHGVLAAGAWSPDVADPAAWCNSSLALDSAGKAHLAYYALGGGSVLRYATNASGTWVTSDIAAAATGGCGAGVNVSLAVDGSGAAYVAFNGDYPAYGLRYATNRGGAWTVSTLDAGYISGLSLAVDQADKVHVAYSNNNGELKFAQDATGAWTNEVLESAGSPGHVALALDGGGKAHLSYLDGRYGGELHYLTNAAGSWRSLPIDTADYDNGGIVSDSAIAVDRQGKVHVAYYRGGGLRYATNRQDP